ncbi:MAG: hypothetical protein PHY16_02095 [Methylobacter sp.]|nr:hypothetical protein [Methylobacter sp.]
MANQTILFTMMPRSISIDPATMPVSVYVSPRLFGDAERTTLDAFPDWLQWTRRLKEDGLSLTFHCNGADFIAPAATGALKPELWEAMFKEDTLVRSHAFDDYSKHNIASYSTRNALSLLKGLYQKASVELALPQAADRQQREQNSNYDKLRRLVKGLEVNWKDNLRDFYRDGGKRQLRTLQAPIRNQPQGEDGLFQTSLVDNQQLADARRGSAQEFAVFHHIPPGQPIEDNPPDFDKLLDFHQVLSSLNSYPELLRALGLVMDFELPLEFVPISFSGAFSVVAAEPGREWDISTSITPVETGYVHFKTESDMRVFLPLPNPKIAEAIGLLALNPHLFGLAQVDVDGGMHKTIMLAETVQDKKDEKGQVIKPPDAPHPEIFDPQATLPSLRSGGLSLYADDRGEKLLRSFQRSKNFQDAANGQQPLPDQLYAEDLIHGYRLDIWDSHTNQWHSLHRRDAVYNIEDQKLTTNDEEGFTQLAAAQPAPNPDNPPAKDMYVHEAMARWAGWSLSAPFPGKVLSSDPDPEKALDQPDTDQNTPATPFKMTTHFKAVGGSLPGLRFGRRYRVRARVVDICGNSLALDHPLLEQLSAQLALPQNAEGFAYLRYEPVISPLVVLRDEKGVTGPGSQVDRLVIRTFNNGPAQDNNAADLTANDRHILPPRASVEVAERLGMLDDSTGKLNPNPAMYDLLAKKDGAELNQVEVAVAGNPKQKFPLEADERIDSLPYIPDVLAKGAALRDLPGAPNSSIGNVQPGPGPEAQVAYHLLDDPNPRPGSATLISFGGEGDWQAMQPFRLALNDGHAAPKWDAENRVLTISLTKGTNAVVPLTSYIRTDDLKLMGVWQWLREYIDQKAVASPDRSFFDPRQDVDRIAHILQRAVEGGHWMLTPPRLLTLVHAVQQPIGVPEFTAIPVQHEPYNELQPDPKILQTAPEAAFAIPTRNSFNIESNPSELNAINAWRKPGSTDAYLLGGLHIHAASTARVDILAEWDDPVDDLGVEHLKFKKIEELNQHHAAPVDEVPINQLLNHVIQVTPDKRAVGYYDAGHDLICFVRGGDRLGGLGDLLDYGKEVNTFPDKDGIRIFIDAAPLHRLNDTKHHRVSYIARSTSRYREYFPQKENLDFTRSSAPFVVDVPASARPVAPQIAYVIPTFGWQRQTQTNLKRSIRFGGGLRIYLERPWFSSGEGELLGVTFFAFRGENISDPDVRDRWKPFITQWGKDPIWQTDSLSELPGGGNFPDAFAFENSLSLEEDSGKRVDVAGYPVAFDEERQKWYCDLIIDAPFAYSPFVRLALTRYQPHALADAKLSRVVLADFAQLTSGRSALVTADPYHPERLQVTISGIKPSGPLPQITPIPISPVAAPTEIEVEVQQLDDTITGDLAWNPAAANIAAIQQGTLLPADESVLWTGTIKFTQQPAPDQFRLLIREYEYISADYTVNSDGTTNPALPSGPASDQRVIGFAPRRLIYAETIAIDAALISQTPSDSRQTKFG